MSVEYTSSHLFKCWDWWYHTCTKRPWKVLLLHKGTFPGGSDSKESVVRETQVRSLGGEDPLEKRIATHSNILAWKIPWMEEPGRLQSMGSQRVGHSWATSLSVSRGLSGGTGQAPKLVWDSLSEGKGEPLWGVDPVYGISHIWFEFSWFELTYWQLRQKSELLYWLAQMWVKREKWSLKAVNGQI